MRKKQQKPITLCVNAGSTFYDLKKLSPFELKERADILLTMAKNEIINTLVSEYFDIRYEVCPDTQTINIEIKITAVPKLNPPPFS